ncbi:hypothetical protein E2C01_062847 [Portunus trituberculatus]|uniref:Uncharacterized protein n=1 Tax=Portunus trituberculatus TaxID=210409 RepID=A0A5B7HEV7_PORTR|nr:hypothetical protein [Portunus trituberculatus]
MDIHYMGYFGAFAMTVAVALETLKRVGNKTLHPKIDRTDMNTVWEGGTKEGEKDHVEQLKKELYKGSLKQWSI